MDIGSEIIKCYHRHIETTGKYPTLLKITHDALTELKAEYDFLKYTKFTLADTGETFFGMRIRVNDSVNMFEVE
jgi:recombinational DNA repair ATPase RecF